MKNNSMLLIVCGCVGWLMGCGGTFKELSLLEQLRVPVAQVLVHDPATAALATCADSERVAESNRYTQQFPVRPGAKTYLRYVSIAPPGDDAITSIVKIEEFSNPLGVGQGSAGATALARYRTLSLSDFAIRKIDCASFVREESPMRIKEEVFELGLPSSDVWLQGMKRSPGVPGYKIHYSTRATSRTDEGFSTLYVLPEPDDSATWTALQVQSPELTPAFPQLKAFAKSNRPPMLSALNPSTDGVIAAQSDNVIEYQLGNSDPDSNAKIRAQWFVTKGKLSNQWARQPKWNPGVSGTVGAFVVVRDLQGGISYLYGKYEAR